MYAFATFPILCTKLNIYTLRVVHLQECRCLSHKKALSCREESAFLYYKSAVVCSTRVPILVLQEWALLFWGGKLCIYMQKALYISVR